ncbi:MAG: Mur ligase family protein, partial [Anaerovoracaceae bacterium]
MNIKRSLFATKNHDKFHIIEDGKRKITLDKICKIMKIPFPEGFEEIRHEAIENVTTNKKILPEGCVLMALDEQMNIQIWEEDARNKHVRAIFVDEEKYRKKTAIQVDLPFITVPNLNEKAGRFFSYIKELYGVKTIAITGTVGKTTTNKLLSGIISTTYKTYASRGNLNSYKAVSNHIMEELTEDIEVFIQEVGAGNIDYVKKASAMLKVDGFILLNVKNHHINKYKTYENLFADKISLQDYMKKGGVIVANFDDEGIANNKFRRKVISFGVKTDKKVDYRAINIVQNNQNLEFDVVYKRKSTHISLQIFGEHNVYNILPAFAMAKCLGIKEEDILKGLKKYKSHGIRQNFQTIGEYKLLLDCYNCCDASLRADIDTVNNFKVEEGKKKVVILGAENKLGKQAYDMCFELGASIDCKGMDCVICVGPEDETFQNLEHVGHGRALADGIKSTGHQNVIYVNNDADLEEAIRRNVEPGDLVLFKGVVYLNIVPIIDKIFGTAYSLDDTYFEKRGTLVESHDFKARSVETLNALDLYEVKNLETKDVVIPDEIQGYPVHRITKRLFKDRENIETLDLGNTVENIGMGAFRGCTKLKK